MKRLRTRNRVFACTLSVTLLAGTFLLGMSWSFDGEIRGIERRIKEGRAHSHFMLLTAQDLKANAVGNEQAAQETALKLANDPEFTDDFMFLKSEHPVEHALESLPKVFEGEDSLLQSTKQANSGIGRLNVWQTARLLDELKHLYAREEWGHVAVLEAYSK